MSIKGFIFDLDGTLADTLPLCIFSFQQAFKEVCGIEFTENEITQHFGKTEEGITKALSPDNWDDCFNAYLKFYRENHHICPQLFEGIENVLDYIGKTYKLAMVTGKGKPSAVISLDYYGIGSLFEYVETGSADGVIKDKCIENIVNKWGIMPEETVYIGDTPSDIFHSKNAGVNPVAVAWASTTNAEELEKLNPFMIFRKTEDFYKWVLNINKVNC